MINEDVIHPHSKNFPPIGHTQRASWSNPSTWPHPAAKKVHDSKEVSVYHLGPFIPPPALSMPLPFALKALPFAVSLLLLMPGQHACAETQNAAQPCPHSTPRSGKKPAPTPSENKPSPDGSIELSADEARYEPDGQMYLQGDVTLQYGPYQASSDQAVLDQRTDSGSLTGLIRIESKDVYVEGRDATVNLETGAASVQSAAFNLKESGLRGQASEVDRPSETELTVRDGFFTTCQPGDNSWSFAVSEVNLDQASGFGTAKHARFQVKDVPVLYVPWFTFPIDDRRKTGFLYPATGSSNTGHGMYLSTPYYFSASAS
jgi:lipopolysaccharide assembly outer membrane protein LptD (OstA)